MKLETMMKWRVRRQSKCSSDWEVNEDVRRSLEILDNVLAEFDDHDIFSSSDSTDIVVNGDDQGSPLSHAHQEKERWEDENGNRLQESGTSSCLCFPNGKVSPEMHSLNGSTDGTTSQITLLDESRRCSAPPVPKRSPGTRLSNRDRPFHRREFEETAFQIRGIHHSTGSLELTSQNGERSRSEIIDESKRKGALSAPTPGTSSSSSPVNDNAQISTRLRHREMITGRDLYLEFYLVRDGDDEDAADDDEVFLSSPQPVDSDVRQRKTSCRVCGGNLDHIASISAVVVSTDTLKLPMDTAKSAHLRRMRLDRKFAKVKLLLKSNQITGLDEPPPSFKPPPPPHHISRRAHKSPRLDKSSASAAQEICNRLPCSQSEKCANIKSSCKQQRPRGGSARGACDANGSAETQNSPMHDISLDRVPVNAAKSPGGLLPKDITCTKCERVQLDLLPTDVLCKNCINKGWTFRSSELVSNSPGCLKRPPLGLSYSMEDDLSPGIKEILSSSLPETTTTAAEAQSDSAQSSTKSSPVTHMSTFSHSASSLGDGSSQSDLDFSTSVDSGKVPLSSIKSLTLPTDMKLGPSPFYSAMEGEHINGTGAKLGVCDLESVRSSSAPPPLQDKGHWKKDKTGFSRKEKHSKSDAVDTTSRQAEEEEVTTEEKPKKRSMWKSILRRK